MPLRAGICNSLVFITKSDGAVENVAERNTELKITIGKPSSDWKSQGKSTVKKVAKGMVLHEIPSLIKIHDHSEVDILHLQVRVWQTYVLYSY